VNAEDLGSSMRCHDAQVVTGSSDQTEPAPPVVIKVSPMAHFAVGFFALGLLVPVLNWPATAPLLIIPVVLSALIIRLRTQADQDGVSVRTLLGGQTARWEEIDGLRFHKGSWARAQLKHGGELRLPAVTFATLPLLTEASAGRVPNPYR
jgi:Bacterial PH domain